jgi:general stress protein 26
VEQYKNNNKACVYFYNARKFQGLMIVGMMEVLTDRASREMIWKDGDEMYYPQGINDPDYCVLKFTGHKIRTYHAFQKEEMEI